jgi:hypothetical protein
MNAFTVSQLEQCCQDNLFYLKRKQKSGVCFDHELEHVVVEPEGKKCPAA